MPLNRSRRLVIDADVAGAAGGKEASHSVAKACRDTLMQVLEICHLAVLSDTLADEWNAHQSSFARRWRQQMVARKKLERINPVLRPELQAKAERVLRRKADKTALAKDFHLVEAALATEQTIISLDEFVRSLLKGACRSVGELRDVVWVNPARPGEHASDWLQAGAKPEVHRRLRGVNARRP